MEFLINIAVTLLTTVAAPVLATVFSHDVCASADRICGKIINRAVARLNESQKDDMKQEWLADLSERQTITEKYQHAIGCYFAAGPMRRQARAMRLVFTFEITSVGTFPMSLEIGPSVSRSVLFSLLGARSPFLVKKVAVVCFMAYLAMKMCRAASKLGPGSVSRMCSVLKNFKQWRYDARLLTAVGEAKLGGILRRMIQDPSQIGPLLNEISNIFKPTAEEPK